MMIRNSEFTDLTKAQVEALLECFDFLRNGFIPIGDFTVSDHWFIRLRHKHNGSMLTVWIFNHRYTIFRNGKLRKMVVWAETNSRYALMVNSDMSTGVMRTSGDGYERLISNSLYDERWDGETKSKMCQHRLA